jgi:YVTN family beta-propeller protein
MKAVLLAMAFTVLAQSLAAANHPILLVVNKQDRTLMFVNAETHEIMGTVAVGKGPLEVAVTPDGKTAYVSNVGDYRNIISVIDVDGMKEIRQITTGKCYLPNGMVITRDGTKMYATYEATRVAAEIDLASEKIVRMFETKQLLTHMLVLSPDEKFLYTANSRGPNVSVFNLETGERVRHVRTKKGCQGIDAKPDGSEVWAAARQGHSITIIATSDNRAARTIDCPGYPMRVKFTPDSKHVLVSCADANLVAVFDAATYEIVERIVTGNTPVGLAIEPGGRHAYVTEITDHTVSVLDLETCERTATIKVGNTPWGLAYVEAR